MPFVAICRDCPAPENRVIRETQLQAHFDYIETILDRLLVAGPVGGVLAGAFDTSIFIYDVDDRAVAEALLHGDPYFRAGLYANVRIDPFLPAAGRWVGGTAWN